MSANPNKLSQFWQELKRRKVFRVVAMYAATAFIIMEAGDIMLPRLGLPDWSVTFIIVLLIVGFPIAIILSWIFDITPEGVKKTESIEVAKEQEQSSVSNKRRQRASDAIIVVLMLVVVVLAYPKIFNKNRALHDFSNESNNIIAVLPFMNNTGDSSNDHWQYGISELLISALSGSNELTVIDNQTISEVVNNVENIQTASIGRDIAKEVASRIKVNSYISGNYLLAGSTFRINLKLIDTKSNKVLKTDYKEGKLDSIFSMVGSLANNINNYLEIKTIKEASNIDPTDYATTSSPEAYRYFIQGLENFWSGKGYAALQFRDAIQIDTTFTSAYFFLSLHLTTVGEYKLAKEAMLKAYEGKDRLPVKMKLWLEAFMAQYIRKNPSQSINYFKQVAEIDPYSRLNWLWLGLSYNLIEKYDEALLSFEEIQNLNEQLGPWRNQYYYIYFGNAYQKLEKYNKAQNTYKKGAVLFPESDRIMRELAICALIQNDTAAANQYLDQIRNVLKNQRIGPESLISIQYVRVFQSAGKIKKAEEMIRLALEMRLSQGPEIDTINSGNNLYWYYDILGNLLIEYDINIEEGMEYCQLAYDLSNEAYLDYHPFVLFPLGLGNYKLGKYQEALKYFKMAEERMALYYHRLHELILETEKALASQNK